MIYQPLDTHINGMLKQTLKKFWMDQSFMNPDNEVSLAATIKQVTATLKDIAKYPNFIKKAFKQSLFTPACSLRLAPMTSNLQTLQANITATTAIQMVDAALNSFTSFANSNTH